MKELIIFVGLPASGKSTFYDLHFKQTHVHINLDIVKTRSKESKLIQESISKGLSIVIDNTNPTPEKRKFYIDIARANGYKLIAYYFDTPLEICKKQNEERQRTVPLVALYTTKKKLTEPKKEEGFEEVNIITRENFLIESKEKVSDNDKEIAKKTFNTLIEDVM